MRGVGDYHTNANFAKHAHSVLHCLGTAREFYTHPAHAACKHGIRSKGSPPPLFVPVWSFVALRHPIAFCACCLTSSLPTAALSYKWLLLAGQRSAASVTNIFLGVEVVELLEGLLELLL